MLLAQLRAFLRVVEEDSLTDAAARLNLSQPAVSRQIAALEAELGVRLFDRSRRQLRLTPVGEAAYPHARRILAAIDDLRSAVLAAESPGRGRVALAAVTAIALYVLPDVLRTFADRFPEATVHVRTGTVQEVVDLVAGGECELGLASLPVSHPGLRTWPLFDDPVSLVSQPTAPWVNEARALTPDQLSHLPMIAYEKPSRFRTYVDAALDQAGISPNVVMEFDSHEAVKTMVGLGLGLAFVPRMTVREDLALGRLIELSVEGLGSMARTTTLLARPEALARPLAGELTNLMLKCLLPTERWPDHEPFARD